jgi:hypothetical protein
VFDAGLANEIRQHCPILEDLPLPFPHSKGDRRELAIYKTLGAIPRLQRPFPLTLSSSDRTVLKDTEDHDVEISNNPSFNEIHQQFPPPSVYDMEGDRPRNGRVRNSLVNSALDETLARAVFQSISTRRGRDTLPVERLKLRAKRGGFFGRNKCTL